MLEASFPKPLLDGKREPETANHLGLQAVGTAGADGAVVAVVVARRPWSNLLFPTFSSSVKGGTVTDDVGQQPLEQHLHKRSKCKLPLPTLLTSAGRSVVADDMR